jgi:hypothetical protein
MTKPEIYDQFDRAFAKVSAWAILKDGKAVGRVAVKYTRDGMGRATFYLQSWGLPMVKGSAAGTGYDKTSAAAYRAAIALRKASDANPDNPDNRHGPEIAAALILSPDGQRWCNALEAAGFDVATVI